jgi:hypothetical protein
MGCGPNRLIWIADAAENPPHAATRFIISAASGHAKPGPAIGFRHGDAQPAGICHGTVKRIGKCAIAVAATPIVIAEARANAAYAVDKVLMLLFDITTHETIRLGETGAALQPELAGVDTNQG